MLNFLICLNYLSGLSNLLTITYYLSNKFFFLNPALGLALCGGDEKIGSKQKGNCIRCMDVIVKFNPFVATQRIRKH